MALEKNQKFQRSGATRQMGKMRVILLGILTLMGAAGFAIQPLQFNYQARLNDSDGSPLEGVHTAYFSLYQGGDAATANSGNHVYTETAAISFSDGVINHTVGTGAVTTGSLSDAVFAYDGPMFLQVAIDSAPNIILPRHQLQSVPFAFRARVAETAISAGSAEFAQSAESSLNGVPSGFMIMSEDSVAPPGFSPFGDKYSFAWNRRRPLPAPRSHFAAAAPGNGKVYLTGGTTTNTCTAFDPDTDSTTDVAPMLTNRSGHTATVVNGLIYAIGGVPLTSNEVFDPGDGPLGTWTAKQPLTVGRSHHGAAAANGNIFVFGGLEDAFIITTSSVEMYDPIADTWTERANLPTGRSQCRAATVGGKIYVIGGTVPGNETTGVNEVYDPISNNWDTKAPLPQATTGGCLAAFGSRLYYIGGFSGNGPVDTVWIYDPETDSWTVGPTLWDARANFGCAMVDSRIFVLGNSVKVEALDAGVFSLFTKD